MPGRTVTDLFKQLFQTDKFVVNESSAFSLTGGSLDAFKRKFRTLRDLTMILASVGTFNGEPFKSMAEYFTVSQTTMAIRLEELGLVEF